MGALSTGVKNSLLDALCRNVAFSVAAVWVQLHTGSPGAAGTSNVATENSRKQLTFGAAASGSASNTGAVSWAAVAATEAITHVSLWSASTTGTFLGSDDITTINLVAGNGASIGVGDITVSLGGTELSDTVKNAMLDAVLRAVSYQNAAVYAKLHTGDPGSAGTTNASTETTRQQVTFGNAASGGSIVSSATSTWTALSTAETHSWISYWSASVGGTFLGRDDITDATVQVGDTLNLTALTVSLSGTLP